MVQLYSKIITTYNLYCPKLIPFRSEALADFMQATILDEMHSFFQHVDSAYHNQFAKDTITIQEQLKQNAKLDSLVHTSKEKLAYYQSQHAGLNAEKETLQLQLDEQHHKIKGLDDEKRAVEKSSQIEMAQKQANFEQIVAEKKYKLHQIKEELDQVVESISTKQDEI